MNISQSNDTANKLKLDEAFWHPKLGLVLSYVYRYNGGMHYLPTIDKTVDLNFVLRYNWTFKCDEVDAPFIVDSAKTLEAEE